MNETTNVATVAVSPTRRVLVGALAPVRPRSSARATAKEPQEAEGDCAPAQPKPSQVALLLAPAYWIERPVESGAVPCAATVAKRLALSRARITQIGDLALLDPRLQEQVLLGGGLLSVTTGERLLRAVTIEQVWESQNLLLGCPREEGPGPN